MRLGQVAKLVEYIYLLENFKEGEERNCRYKRYSGMDNNANYCFQLKSTNSCN